MSYILEALKRADAERERGAVPGLHAQSIALGEADDAPRRVPGYWRWIVLGFLIGLSGLAAGWWFARGDASNRDAAAASALTRPGLPAAAVTPPPPPVEPAAVAAAPAPGAESGTAPAAAKPAPVRKPPQPSARANPGAGSGAPARTTAPAAREPTTRTAAPKPPPAAPRVPRYADLSEAQRREIPTLAVGGAMYSDNRANRMLILNGQLMREGDEPAPGLVLEQIRPKNAVLNYKGQRYEISF